MIVYLILRFHVWIESQNPQDPIPSWRYSFHIILLMLWFLCTIVSYVIVMPVQHNWL